MIKGTPTKVGTYLGRFIVADRPKSPIYKVVYLYKNHGILLAPDGSYAVAEALTYCPDCQVMEDKEGNLFIGNPNVIDTRFPLHHPKNL